MVTHYILVVQSGLRLAAYPPTCRSAFERLPRAVGELVGSSTGPVLPYASVAPAAPNSPWPSSSAPAPMREAHEQWDGFSRGAPAAPFRAPAVGPSMGGNKAIAAADETAAIIVKNVRFYEYIVHSNRCSLERVLSAR